MEQMKEQLTMMIRTKFKSEAECARLIGWPKQRLNKIINATKEPDISEVEAIANAIEQPVSLVADIFLLD